MREHDSPHDERRPEEQPAANRDPSNVDGVPRALKPCGTEAAYRRHIAHGEPPCAACRASQEGRGHRPNAESRWLHRQRGEQWCDICGDTALRQQPRGTANAAPTCGTDEARARHVRWGETCQTCGPLDDVKAPGRRASRPHGTVAAVRRHEYHREPLCDECKPVRRKQARERWARKLARRAAAQAVE